MYRRLLLPALLALLIWPAWTTGDGPPAPTWAGTWRTVYGSLVSEMTLSAGGSGTYDFCGGRIEGTVRKLEGVNALDGTWYQTHPCGGAVEGSGPFEFVMSADGRSFNGRAAYASDPPGTWRGTWNGTCTAGECLKNGQTDENGFGTSSIVPPRPGATARLSSPAIPAGTDTVTAEVKLSNAQRTEEAMAILVKYLVGQKRNRQFRSGCLIFGLLDPDWNPDNGYRPRDRTYDACMRILAESVAVEPAGARASAGGCKAVAVPIHSGTKRPSRRQHRQTVARLRASVRTSCATPSSGSMTVNVSPRGRGNTIRTMLGKKALAGYARTSPPGASDGPNARLNVTWKAR